MSATFFGDVWVGVMMAVAGYQFMEGLKAGVKLAIMAWKEWPRC